MLQRSLSTFCLTRHILASLPLRQLYSDWLPVTNRRSEQLIASGSAFKLSKTSTHSKKYEFMTQEEEY